MADRPVDDILADLLALEEEVAAETAAGSTAPAAWDPEALLTDPTDQPAAGGAGGDALLADCDALLADVDLLLSDSSAATATARPHQATAQAGRHRPAHNRQGRGAAAADAATAAVLSECDALLADADLLLTDPAEQHTLSVQAAAAAAVPPAVVPEAVPQPDTAAVDAVGVATPPPAAPATAGQAAEASGVSGASHTDAAAGPAVLQAAAPAVAAEPAPTQGINAAVAPAAAVSTAAQAGDAAAVPAAAAVEQAADVDLLLMELLSPKDGPAAAAGAPAVPDSDAVQPFAAGATSGQKPSPSQQQQQHSYDEPQQQGRPQQQQQQQGSASSSVSGEDDFLGDMLHDMAEVLEVDEGSLGTHQQQQQHQQQHQHQQQQQAALDLTPSQPTAGGLAGSAVHMGGASSSRGAGSDSSASSSSVGNQAPAGVPGPQVLPSTAAFSGLFSSSTGSEATITWQAGVPAGSSGVPAHELALQQAWAQEEALVHGDLTDSPPPSPTAAAGAGGAAGQQAAGLETEPQQQQRRKRRRLEPLPRLQELLSDALADWNPAGRPDASGTAMIGGSVLLCLESLAGLFAAGAAAAGAASGVDWGQVLSAALAPHGQLQAVAASGQYLAVGAASGSTLVFQLPVPQAAAGGQGSGSGPHNPQHSTGSGHSPLPGGAAMWQLGGQSGGERGVLGFDPVSSLGFSIVGAAGDALWLAVGHVSGALTVWELQKRGPRQIAGIAQHSSRVTFTSFMPGRATSLLLSGDVRGRCCLHTFSASLLRTNVASRVLIGGEYGPLLSIAHLTPFSMQPAALPGAVVRGARDGGAVEWPDAAAWKMLCEDGAWRVGEGICCLTTPTHTYIARVKPSSGDLVMLFSIPQPHPGAQQEAVPVAAWLPHNRQQGGGCPSRVSGDTLMPLALLALGWGSRLVLFEVPLVGDQLTAGEAAAVSVTASQAAAAAQQAKRPHQPAAVAAAAASRLWQQRSHAALDSLTPEAAIAAATQFPLSTCASWAGGQQPQGQSAAASAAAQQQVLGLQQHQLLMGPAEPLPILGVHWLDADTLAVVCSQGYSSLLLVLGLTGSSSSSSSGSADRGGSAGLSQPASLRVYEQVEWMDQPVDRAWGSAGVGVGGLTAWGCDCGGSVVGSGARMYLLGQQGGLFCGRLMPWSERLKTLQDVRKYKLGMYFALRFYLSMRHTPGAAGAAAPPHQQQQQQLPTPRSKSSSSGGPTALAGPRQSVGGFARSEGVGAEPQQLEQWLLSLVLGHAAATLTDTAAAATLAAAAKAADCNGAVSPPGAAAGGGGDSTTSSGSGGVPAAVVAAAQACVCTCLLLSRTDVLFGRVFQLFAQQGVVPGGLGALVEVVELAVLSDLLQGLAPEVMQALVDHFASKGQPGRVEACVVHLPIMSLDLNQVIRLCEGCGLTSALAHIYNQMGDFRKPLLDLLALLAGAGSWGEGQAAAYKLLVYLRCCFRGMAFPPGTGSLPTEPAGVRDVIQATLLGSLLFLDRADLIREWQQAGGAAAAVAAAALAAPQQPTGGAGGPAVLSALCDPHPALQLLLAVDVPATITVLAEATAGWDAVETDLRTAAGKPTTELESVLVATQVVVNALVTLLEGGRFQQWQQAHQLAANSTSSGSSSSTQPVGAEVAMGYIIQLLAAGRVNAKPSFVIKLLQHLVAQATAAAAAAAAAASAGEADGGTKDSTAATAAAAAALAPFEQQFMAIVQVVGVQSGVEGSASAPRGNSAGACPSAFNPQQAREVLALAKRCRFVKATATVHHLQGNYAAALSCFLALAETQGQTPSTGPVHQQQQQQQQQEQGGRGTEGAGQQGVAAGQAVFDYINSFLGGGSGGAGRQAFLACVCQQVVQLIRLDAAATAAVLLAHMPEQQVPVLLSLQDTPGLQFHFLRAAMQQNQQQAQRQSGHGTAATPAAAAAAAAVGPSGSAAAAGGVESLLERPEVAILYVKLLARFEPDAVLPFLQSHHNYSVAEAIKVCRAAGVHDAEAFLHERLGDLDAALRLYLSTTQHANADLQAAVLHGGMPLLLLPPGYWVPGWFDRRSTAKAGHGGSGSNNSSREQPCWGLEQLVRQLESVSAMVTQATAAAGASRQPAAAAAAAAPADLQQSADQLLTAAAHVAATLLHCLHPTLACAHPSSSSRKLDRAPSALPAASNGGAAVDGGTSSGAAALQLPPPVVDLYKAWMAQLSPRLRLKGLGAGVGTLAGAAAAAGPHMLGAAGGGGSSSAGSTQAAGAAAIPAVPAELAAAWQALQAAVAFCQRNTRPGSGSGGSNIAAAAASGRSAAAGAGGSSSAAAAAAAGGQELWFQLMDVYVAGLRSVHASQLQEQGANGVAQEVKQPQDQLSLTQQQQQQQQQLVSDLGRAVAQQVPLQELASILRAAASAVAARQVLPGLLRLLLDEVVCCMADHLPLLDIVGRIIRRHGNERFGEFRSTLLGLFGATGSDSAIMAAANRLITGDAFTAVRHAYGLRQLARAIQEQQQQQEDPEQRGAAGGSSSTCTLLVAPAVAAASAPVGAVQSAVLLGVLGPGSYDAASSSGRIGSRYSLTQADRDLIQGILGLGGMRLQLQPAGPVTGVLPGVTAAYRAAAQAVADTGRMFQGEMDLALELAMLQSLQEHRQQQQQRHGEGKGEGTPGGVWGAAGEWAGDRGEAAGVASPGGRVAATTSSFDIDDLLNWSTTNM